MIQLFGTCSILTPSKRGYTRPTSYGGKRFTLLILSFPFLWLTLFGYFLAVDGNPYQPDSEPGRHVYHRARESAGIDQHGA